MGSEVILTSKLCTEVGLYNGAKGKVIGFVYIDASGPSNFGVPEVVAVKFRTLSGENDIQPCLDGYPRSVAIPMKHIEWKHNVKTLIRTQF